MSHGGVGTADRGRRRGALARLALAPVACLALLGWAAVPASGATAATTPATVPAASVPTASGAPVPVPPIPSVPLSITNNEDPAALLNRAIALSSVGVSQAPLQATLALSQQVLDAQSVAANQATAAAQAATQRASAAEATAAVATASASSLQGALREAALRLYTGGTMSAIPTNPGTTADEFADAAAYEETILSPDGILEQRKAVAAVARNAAAEKVREQAAALHDQADADAAFASAAAATSQIRAQVAVLGTATATLVSSERAAVSSQAGQSLTTPAALDFTPSTPLPAPVATTSVALAWAFSELGTPYVWGGTGPGVFDCSGLTQYSWAHAGVAIPRVAADQDSWTVPVPLSQLLPGDLVFYGSTDIHHVGMYIGDGLMINAPHTGDVVRVSPIWWSDLAGFGRTHTAGVPLPARVLPADTHPAPPAVIPTVGAVPSESTPPPGYVAPPGATAPVVPPTTLPASTSTTLPDTTTTAVPGPTTTTLPTAGATSTTTTSTTVPSTTSTTTAGVLGLGG
jgi:cell wall-associated NlpC family hydrolase